MASPLGDQDDWRCAICLELLYKPCINTCGHAACFWCMHQAMNPYEPSACPLCRTRFAHFPRVCPRLHALLEAAFPEAYARRAAETAELEAERGAESEAVAVDAATLESAKAFVAPRASAAAAAPAGSCEGVGVRGGGGGGPSSSGVAGGNDDDALAPPPAALACDACARLLLDPSALPCGHVVCGPCVPGGAAGAAVPGAPAAAAAVGAPGGRSCPACGIAVVTQPGLFIMLDKLLRSRLPHSVAARAREAAAAGGGPGGGGEQAAGVAAVVDEGAAPQQQQHHHHHHHQQQQQQQPAPAGAQQQPAQQQPEQSQQQHHQQQQQPPPAGHALGAAAGPPPEVAALLASGRPMRELWPDLQAALARVADTRYVWHAVGCDDCGAYPIVGRRFRCSDCPEAIGYDLCGPCHDRGPAGRGRFNQQHRPEHRLEKVEPHTSWGDIHEPRNFSALVNFLQMVHPELSHDRILQLLWMHMAPDRLAAAVEQDLALEQQERQQERDQQRRGPGGGGGGEGGGGGADSV